jgi:hypothetical protein
MEASAQRVIHATGCHSLQAGQSHAAQQGRGGGSLGSLAG